MEEQYTPDKAGGYSSDYSFSFSVWAKIEHIRQKRDLQGIIVPQQEFKATIRENHQLRLSHHILYNDLLYEIEKIEPYKQEKHYITLQCKEAKNNSTR